MPSRLQYFLQKIYIIFIPPPQKGSFFAKVSHEQGEKDTQSRQQSVANLMHIPNGNTASWWDFWYFVFIKILISVSLPLLFVFFVCLFEKQTLLPAPVVLWAWFCLTLIYFAQQFKSLVPDPANTFLHVDLRARKARRVLGLPASGAPNPSAAKCILTQKETAPGDTLSAKR